ncbi:MAG: Tad domain-containing protein [Hyphomicrobiaceae bacterium]
MTAGFAAEWSAISRLLCVGWTDRRGSVVTTFAIALPVMLLIAGGAIDYGMLVTERGRAQRAADSASLAGAKELSLADSNRQNVPAVVDAVVASYLSGNSQGISSSSYNVATQIIDKSGAPLQVEVNLSAIVKSSFGENFGFGDTEIGVKSVAVVVGKPNICLLALDPSASGTIQIEQNAVVHGQNCAIYSNSAHSNGIKAYNSSVMTATVICSAGGKDGGKGSFNPEPLLDCPQFQDPLSARPEPKVGGCVATDLIIKDQTVTLSEGTYCGGISIIGTSRVKFSPGVYVVKDGPLLLADSTTLEGENAGFFFSGNAARFKFAAGTTVSLTAPKTGPMAGLLFFASRAQAQTQYEIFSDNARQLLGTIYLPNGQLSIDANKPIADQSAYTAIVVRRITANSGPTVTLNTNYDLTEIPVPDGIRGAGQPVALAK